MPGESADTATREKDTLWVTVQTMGVVSANNFMNNSKMFLCTIDTYSRKWRRWAVLQWMTWYKWPNDICKIWTTHRNELHIRDVQRVLQADENTTVHNIILLHQSNGQVESCIQFLECLIKKCLDTNQGVSHALLQIRTTFIGAGLPSPAGLLFDR